jgi:signal transduction histidine kinase
LTKSTGEEVELDFADEFMPEFESSIDAEYFEVFLDLGTLLERSHSFEGYEASHFSDQEDAIQIRNNVLPDGRAGRLISIKFTPQIQDKSLREQYPEEGREKVIVRVSRERESLNQILLQLHMLIIGIGFIVVISIMLGVSRVVNKTLQPLIRIKDEISQISPKSIDRRLNIENQPIELEPIATQFNLVLSEIENALVRERQFSSDVAHELRTPVSEIRSLAEVGLRWPDEKDVSTYFADIHQSSSYLDSMISNLLHLCRCDEGQFETEISGVQLDQMIDKNCAQLAFESGRKNISFDLPKQRLPTLLADVNWFGLLLLNLISNAIAHSPSNARVKIDVITSSDRCAIEIKNPMFDCPSKSDLSHIFDRFWRKDSARTTGEHAGIGLSLVKSYSSCLNMGVDASVSDDNMFNIRLSNIKIVY